MDPLVRITATLGLLVASWGCGPRGDEADCDLERPPRDSGIEANSGIDASNGRLMFIYPRRVADSYSGCQSMWDESGVKILSLRFRQGELIESRFSGAPPAVPPLVCTYEKGMLAPGSPAECAASITSTGGFRSFPEGEEPVVPPERDPRS
jgi:hypothetical protein